MAKGVDVTVGERIKQRRIELGWTRRRLSEESGVPYPTLAGLENGDQLSSTALPALAVALRTNPLWLSNGQVEDLPVALVISQSEYSLLTAFRELAAVDQRVVIRIVEAIRSNSGS